MVSSAAGRPLLFYNDWPLGYVNREAERKARSFAAAGYDVTYMTGAGIRNPRLTRVSKLARHAVRAVGEGRRGAGPATADALATASLLVCPPRQWAPVRRANTAWVGRQLRSTVPRWGDAVAWIRSPTPELVRSLSRDPPATVVYEVIDAHHQGPGITGVWREIFDVTERRLVALADLVVVTNPPLAPRFAALGADPQLVPHGVDLFPWRPPDHDGPTVLGFVGVLDVRLDVAVIRHVAAARPQWRIRLVGPVEAGFDPGMVADLPNVSVEPPVPHDRVGEILGDLDLGLLAYADLPGYAGMSPLKLLELFAAGRTAVVRPNASTRQYADLVRFASTPAEFLLEIERALDADSPAAAGQRRAVAERRSWTQVTDELLALLARTLEGPGAVAEADKIR